MLIQKPNILIQGLTGKEGTYWTEKMMSYGSRIVAGVTPGKGGTEHVNIPIYDTVEEALLYHKADLSIIFVPPSLAKNAALEAIYAGVKQVIVLADGVPVHDALKIVTAAKENGVQVIGPNCPGIIAPVDHYFAGIMPAWLDVFQKGKVSLVSRSGSLGNEFAYQIQKAGHGLSWFVGIGGDPVVGTTILDTLKDFENDPGTEAVVIVGELGGTMEEDAAEFISSMKKSVFAFISGKTAPEGKRMGHAGAIIEGDKGSVAGKKKRLSENGAFVAETPFHLCELLKTHLK